MLKKTIKYEDFDGNEVTEDFYFNLTKAELAKIELLDGENLRTSIDSVIEESNGEVIIDLFERLILMSVGRRSEDGRQFIKTDEVKDAFRFSNAYSELFLELVQDGQKSADFVAGIVPKGMADQVKTAAEIDPIWERENRDPTDKEIREMSPAQLRKMYIDRTRANKPG